MLKENNCEKSEPLTKGLFSFVEDREGPESNGPFIATGVNIDFQRITNKLCVLHV